MADAVEQVGGLTAEEQAILEKGEAPVEAAAPPPAPVAPPPATEPPPKYVPLEALHEERNARKELQAKLKTQEENFDKLKAGLEEVRSRFNPHTPVPDPDTDPLGHQQYLLEKVRREQEALQSKTTQTFEELQRQVQENSIRQQVVTAEMSFRSAHPDYDPAINFLRTKRTAELNALGFTDPNVIENVLKQDAWAIAINAMNNGRNPAEAAYAVAKANGYNVAPPLAAPSPAAQHLNAIAAGQAAQTTLPQGGTNPIISDVEQLLNPNLTQREFEEALERFKREGKI